MDFLAVHSRQTDEYRGQDSEHVGLYETYQYVEKVHEK